MIAIVTRYFPVWFRILTGLFALGFLVTGAVMPIVAVQDGDPAMFIPCLPFLLCGAFFLRMASVRMVASEDGIQVRNYFRTYDIGWAEVAAVFPSREGLVLALHERRPVVLLATVKASLPWKVPCDEEAFAYLTEHMRRARR